MKVTFNLLFIFFISVLQANSQHIGIEKSAYYTVLASGNAAAIDEQLSMVKEADIDEKNAYEGTLLMKKAQLAGKSKDKLNLFKAGRSKLESSISTHKENTEYRFLRLIIQEHAPKIVKYRNNLEEDSKLIRANFKSLSQVLQQIISGYSKKSSVLKIN
jgi:hypothetical protein